MKVALVFANEQERRHWNLSRLLKRGGLQDVPFVKLTLPELGDDSAQVFHSLGVKAVVPMGLEPLYELLGETDCFRWMLRYVEAKGLVYIPTLAPSDLLVRRGNGDDDDEDDAPKWKKVKRVKNPARFTQLVILALKRAIKVAREGLPPVPEQHYLLDPTPSQFRDWVDAYVEALRENPDLPLAFDTETDYYLRQRDEADADANLDQDSKIIRMSAAWKPHHAVSLPWEPRFLPDIRRLLQSAGSKVGANSWTFDEPLLERNGMPLRGLHYDVQDAFHVYQSDLPKGLEAVTALFTRLLPWKHLSDSAPALYACIDADATIQNWLGVRAELEAGGQWQHYLQQYVRLAPVLRRAGDQGTLIDDEERLKLRTEFREDLRARLLHVQSLVPQELQRRKLYLRIPKTADPAAYGVETSSKIQKFCSVCEKPNINRRHNCKQDPGWQIHTREIACEKFYKLGPDNPSDVDSVEKWLKQNGFNPNSSQQLIAYMKRFRHPVGQNHKTEEDSADAKHLAKLEKRYGDKHPLYGLALELHKIKKALSTYVDGMQPAADGRIHTTYVNSPSTGRLGSRNPNLQNISKRGHNPWAKRARKIFVAPLGYVFVQADFSAIEAVLVGYFAGDEDFIRYSKQSIHAFMACRKLGWEFTPTNVARVKKEYEDLYALLKQTVYLSLYLGSPYMMLYQAPETFRNVEEARESQEFFFGLFPKIRAWQEETLKRARKEGVLKNPWGGRHYFNSVFTYKYDDDGQLVLDFHNKPKIVHGPDSKRAAAFTPQSSAGMITRDTCVLIGESEWAPYMPATLTVHDSVKLCVPEAKAEVAADFLIETMTRPITELGGLRVGVEVEVGTNWLEMKPMRKVTTLEEEEVRKAA